MTTCRSSSPSAQAIGSNALYAALRGGSVKMDYPAKQEPHKDMRLYIPDCQQEINHFVAKKLNFIYESMQRISSYDRKIWRKTRKIPEFFRFYRLFFRST